eukprot:485538-Rhodomonas_salina.1
MAAAGAAGHPGSASRACSGAWREACAFRRQDAMGCVGARVGVAVVSSKPEHELPSVTRTVSSQSPASDMRRPVTLLSPKSPT